MAAVRRRPRLRAALLTGVIAAVLPLAACGGSADTAWVSVSSGPTADAAPKAGAELSPGDFAAALKRPGTVLLDVRTPQEYAEGHLPGAINIDVESPSFTQQLATLDPAGTYAVYCRSGNRSGVALQTMQAAGFTSAYHLGGGIVAWQDSGGEVVTD